MADATLTIALEAQKANQVLNQFRSNTEKQLNSLQSGFNTLRTVAVAAVAVFAGRKIVSGIQSVIAAASRQEDAVNSLNSALQQSGEFSEAASQDLRNFATALQNTSKFADEAIIESLALAKAFGATNEQAKLVTQAATELAARTGKSLDEATKQVSKTLGGMAGELGELNPAIRSLTQEQLKAGDAARLLIAQFGGSAEAQLKTFSGSTGQLSNTFGDLLETFGNIIIANPALISSFNILREGLASTIGLVAENADGFGGLLTIFANIVSASIPPLITGFQFAFVAVNTFAEGFAVIPTLFQASLNFVLIGIEKLRQGFLVSVNFLLQKTSEVSKFFGANFDFTKTIEGNTKSINESEGSVDSLIQTIANIKDPFAPLIKSTNTANKGINDVTKSTKGLEKSQKDLQAQAQKTLTEVEKIATENETLRLSISKIGKTTEQVAKIELDFQVLKINNQIESIKGNTNENKSLRDQLTVKRELLIAQAKLNAETSKAPSGGVAVSGSPSSQPAQAKAAGRALGEAIQSPFAKAAAIFSEGLTVSQNFFRSIGSAFDNAAKVFMDVVGGGLLSVFANIGSTLINIPNVLQGIFDGVDNLFSNPKQAEAISNIEKARDTELEKISQDFKNNVITADQANARNAGVLANANNQIQDATENIKSVFDSFPEFFGKLIERIPELFNKIIEIVRQVFPTIIESLPQIVSDLTNSLIDLAIVFVEEVIPALIRRIPAIINAFLSALPRLITAIARNLGPLVKEIAVALPQLVQVIADNISPIVIALTQGITEAIPDIVIALVDQLIVKGGAFRIGFAIAKGILIDLPLAIAQGILRGLANVGSGAFTFLANIFSKAIKFPPITIPKPAFVDQLTNLFNSEPAFIRQLRELFASFNPFGGGGGGGGGFVGQVGRAIGLTDGGTIPRGFPNDTFPARLTSGEEVISQDRSQRLDRFLNRELGQDKNITINLQVGESSLASVIYSLNQRGFRTA